MTSPFVQHTLPNGLSIAIETMPSVQSAACGFLVRTGSRDDPAALAGVSHFLEHMCFKGTPRFTAEQINVGFDDIGADHNAQTGKDQTFYYSWARTEDFERQFTLLADMMRATLPTEEFEMERGVILEEIAQYKDDLASTTYDFLYEKACADSPLAQGILGTNETIGAMTRDQMHGYFTHRYRPGNLILVAAGELDPDQVIRLAERHCGDLPNADDPTPPRRAPVIQTGFAGRKIDRFHQQAVAIAFPSASAIDPLDETAETLAVILGGPNSRFFWNIFQEGLATQVGAMREDYHDCGILILYGLCDPANTERLFDALRHEARTITDQGVEPKELQRVKNLRRTGLASEVEAPGYRIGQIADDVDYRGVPRPTEERLAEVDAVTRETIAQYLQRYPINGDGFVVSVGPLDWPGRA